MNYSVNMNLLALNKACIVEVAGRTCNKKGVFIPIEDNDIFISEKGNAYLHAVAYENTNYGNTHTMRLSKEGEAYKALTPEEKKAQCPYFGNFRELPALQSADPQPTATATLPQDSSSSDDLPF